MFTAGIIAFGADVVAGELVAKRITGFSCFGFSGAAVIRGLPDWSEAVYPPAAPAAPARVDRSCTWPYL